MKVVLIMGLTASAFSAVTSAAAQAEANPIESCRITTRESQTHIECLETALSELLKDQPTLLVAEKKTFTEHNTKAPEALGAISPETASSPMLENVSSEINDFAVTSAGAHVFFLSNGQVWMQKPADQSRIKLTAERTYTASITAGAISGARLRVNELNRTLLVEQIK